MNNLLSEMGITIWRQRNMERTPRIVCIAEAAHADHDLLNNILKALSFAPDEAQIIWVDDRDSLKNKHWPDVPVIVFGESLYDLTPASAIRSVRLNALSENIPAKKALWQALKSLS